MGVDKLKRNGVPQDYPGRIVRFPDGTKQLVVAVLGAQDRDARSRTEFINAMTRLAADADGPARLERGECVDVSGMPTSVLMAYWPERDTSQRWWSSAAVTRYWRGLPHDGDTGYFHERMSIPRERFNYAAGTEDKHGSAAVFELEACATFGYWGAYRDRLPASKTDGFESPLTAVSVSPDKYTRGRRLSVSIPDNLCYIREGQGWGKCGAEERKIWDHEMNGVIDKWVERLGEDPVATGCLSIRDCIEVDPANGETIARRSQIAFLLSLAHIEQAARTDPAHLAVHGAFVKMYREPRFTPQMHVWVEIGVMKHDEVDTEYVNCHPRTGLLPYFDTQVVA